MVDSSQRSTLKNSPIIRLTFTEKLVSLEAQARSIILRQKQIRNRPAVGENYQGKASAFRDEFAALVKTSIAGR